MVKNLPAMQEFDPWVRKIPWKRGWLPTPAFLSGEWTGEPGGLQFMGCKELDITANFTFVGKVMYLLFNMLSSFAIAFLPRSSIF